MAVGPTVAGEGSVHGFLALVDVSTSCAKRGFVTGFTVKRLVGNHGKAIPEAWVKG